MDQIRGSRVVTIAVILGLFCLCSQSQDAPANKPARVVPGDAQVKGAILKPYKNLWRVRITHANGKVDDVGSWSDELTADKLDGRDIYRRTQVSLMQGEFSIHINAFDAQTLAPISADVGGFGSDGGMDPKRHFHRDFNGAKIHLHATNPRLPSGSRDVEATLDTAPFDFFGGMYGIIIAGMPLKQGYAATFPAVQEFQNVQEWVNLSVAGKEQVSAGRQGMVEVWKVDVVTSSSGKMEFWIVEKAPYIIKLVNTLPDGEKWAWEMY